MFGTMKSGANAYAKVGVETGVLAASPHKLIVMLFEGAMVAVSTAARQMEAGDIGGKGKSISKAITIIENGLRASLDRKAGGEIAANLESLYDYMAARLLLANRVVVAVPSAVAAPLAAGYEAGAASGLAMMRA